MNADIAGLIALLASLSLHLVATAWWAASLTKRVDYLEKWIAAHARTSERLAALEQRIDYVGGGVDRIEYLLRQRT